MLLKCDGVDNWLLYNVVIEGELILVIVLSELVFDSLISRIRYGIKKKDLLIFKFFEN